MTAALQSVDPDPGRGNTARAAIALVLTLEANRRGLRLEEVSEIVGGGRRTAYRWIGWMVDSGRYEWKSQFLRRTRVVGTPPKKLDPLRRWKGAGPPLRKGERW